MLRIQPYIVGTHDVVGAFTSIFDESELPYLNKVQISSPSYVALDRRGLIQAFILTQKTPEAHTNCEIAYVGVAPRYRRKGYAERLIRMVVEGKYGQSIRPTIKGWMSGKICYYINPFKTFPQRCVDKYWIGFT